MCSVSRTGRHATWLLASAVGIVMTAEAQQNDTQGQQQESQPTAEQQGSQQIAAAERDQADAGSDATLESWSRMEGEVVHAEELLEGNVTNGLNPIGSVADLVLSEDRSRVEFILYEVPYPYSFYGSEDGFTTFEGVDIFRDAAFELDVRLPVEARPQAPEELRLTAAEAERRLVSRIIGERLYFSDDVSRRIEDLLVDRETGEVLHYVVEADSDAIFSADLRTVPAEQISIDDQGQITATITLANLDNVQEYDSELL